MDHIEMTGKRAQEIFEQVTERAGGTIMPETRENWAGIGLRVDANLGTNEVEVLLGTGIVADLQEAKEFVIGSLIGYHEAIEAGKLRLADGLQAALKLGLSIGLAAGNSPKAAAGAGKAGAA